MKQMNNMHMQQHVSGFTVNIIKMPGISEVSCHWDPINTITILWLFAIDNNDALACDGTESDRR